MISHSPLKKIQFTITCNKKQHQILNSSKQTLEIEAITNSNIVSNCFFFFDLVTNS